MSQHQEEVGFQKKTFRALLLMRGTDSVRPLQGGRGRLSQHHREERHAARGPGAAGLSEMSEAAPCGGAGDGEHTGRFLKLRPGKLSIT